MNEEDVTGARKAGKAAEARVSDEAARACARSLLVAWLMETGSTLRVMLLLVELAYALMARLGAMTLLEAESQKKREDTE